MVTGVENHWKLLTDFLIDQFNISERLLENLHLIRFSIRKGNIGKLWCATLQSITVSIIDEKGPIQCHWFHAIWFVCCSWLNLSFSQRRCYKYLLKGPMFLFYYSSQNNDRFSLVSRSMVKMWQFKWQLSFLQ